MKRNIRPVQNSLEETTVLQLRLGTARNISEMKRNFKGYCLEKGIEICADEMESFEAAARDMLANRFSVIIGKIHRDIPKEDLKKMLLDILK